jgi:hypothetical protein
VNEALRFGRRSHQPDIDALSAYTDGRLGTAAGARIEAHLASCEACRDRLAEIEALRSMLRATPEAPAPRSFRLRPADVEAPHARAASPPRLMRMMPALSAAAVVVLAIVVGIDVASRSGSSSNSMRTAAAPAAESRYAADGDTGKSVGEATGAAAAPAPSGGIPQTGAADSAAGTASGAIGAETPPATEQGVPNTAEAPYAATAASRDSAELQASRPAASPTAELRAASRTEGEGGSDGNAVLRAIEVASGAMAVATGGAAVIWRLRKKEEA